MSTKDHPDWWRPVGGSNAQDSVLERHSTIWNDGDPTPGDAPPWIVTAWNNRGKFFPRGMRGIIEEVYIYCIRTAAGTLDLSLSVHPGLGPLYTVTITPGAAWAWQFDYIWRMWNYDSLFVWVSRCDVDVSWGMDELLPYDYHFTADDEETWSDDLYRPYIRIRYSGETPGDVPVSGVVNTIEVPSVASTYTTAVAVAVPDDTPTLITNVVGAGEVIAAAVDLDISVTPTLGDAPAAVVYTLEIYVDGAFAWAVTNRSLTQSCVATSGRAVDGVFYQCTQAEPAWDLTGIATNIILKFRRTAALYITQTSGGACNAYGTLYVNLIR